MGDVWGLPMFGGNGFAYDYVEKINLGKGEIKVCDKKHPRMDGVVQRVMDKGKTKTIIVPTVS
jgi:hypothetical protein